MANKSPLLLYENQIVLINYIAGSLRNSLGCAILVTKENRNLWNLIIEKQSVFCRYTKFWLQGWVFNLQNLCWSRPCLYIGSPNFTVERDLYSRHANKIF